MTWNSRCGPPEPVCCHTHIKIPQYHVTCCVSDPRYELQCGLHLTSLHWRKLWHPVPHTHRALPTPNMTPSPATQGPPAEVSQPFIDLMISSKNLISLQKAYSQSQKLHLSLPELRTLLLTTPSRLISCDTPFAHKHRVAPILTTKIPWLDHNLTSCDNSKQRSKHQLMEGETRYPQQTTLPMTQD